MSASGVELWIPGRIAANSIPPWRPVIAACSPPAGCWSMRKTSGTPATTCSSATVTSPRKCTSARDVRSAARRGSDRRSPRDRLRDDCRHRRRARRTAWRIHGRSARRRRYRRQGSQVRSQPRLGALGAAARPRTCRPVCSVCSCCKCATPMRTASAPSACTSWGWPTAASRTITNVKGAWSLFEFNAYLWGYQPRLQDGDTFSRAGDGAVRYRLKLGADRRYPDGHPYFNLHGVWELPPK